MTFNIPMTSRLVYPVRVGEHSNSAFGLAMALDYTRFVSEDAISGWDWMDGWDWLSLGGIANVHIPRTSAVADYLGTLEAAIVSNSTNFYGDNNTSVI